MRASGYKAAWVEIWAGKYNFSYYIPSFSFEAANYIRLYAGYNQSLEIAYFYITNDHTGQVNWYSNTTRNFKNEIHPIDAAYYYADVSWHGNRPTQWPGGVWNHENFSDFYSTCQ